MVIRVESKRKKPDTLRNQHPHAVFLDVTSSGIMPWLKFSPFFPHGSIPVPFSPGVVAESVEGIWQALKVFEKEDVDISKLNITSMTGIKRSSRGLGRVLGHRAGVEGARLLSYIEARLEIYLPSYRWIVENCLKEEMKMLREMTEGGDIVLLDYDTNEDVWDQTRPLSHASLIVKYITGEWPGDAA